MKLPVSLVVVLALLVNGCGSSTGMMKDINAAAEEKKVTLLQTAQRVLAEEKSQAITDYFRTEQGTAAIDLLQGGDLFLLGKAFYQVSAKKIKVLRMDGHVGMGLLTTDIIHDLTLARDLLLKSVGFESEAEFAAEALYLAALIMDHGYLQRYLDAMELYRWVSITYPDSQFGKKSAERYEALGAIFKGIEGTSH